MPRHFGFIAGATAVAALGIAWSEGGLVPGVLLPVGTTLAATLGAVQLLKLANRNAQRRIAAGEFLDLQALGVWESDDSVDGPPLSSN